MSQMWEFVGPGRYALEFHGHILQAIRNPDKTEAGARPYLAVVDRVPLAPAEWSLARAKTKAMRHVLNKLGKPKPKGNAFQPGKLIDAFSLDELEKAVEESAHNGTPSLTEALLDVRCDVKSAVSAYLPPEPEPAPELDGVFDLPPDPPASPEATPNATLAGEPGVLVITGHVTNPDLLAGLNEIKSLLELMREHAEVKCHINMPPVLIL